MKWEGFRRSENVEDYRDPNKPVPKEDTFTINEIVAKKPVVEKPVIID